MLDSFRFADNRALAVALGARISADLAAALAQRDVATLAVSGGSTPRPLFEQLAREEIDWARVVVTQVDERWVDEAHADSNARLIRESLLQGRAARARFVSLKTPGNDAFSSEAEVAGRLADFAGGIDVVVLGMGEDGHTASFFPGADSLERALDPAGSAVCVAVRPPHAAHDRMTLSLAALLRSKHRYLHIAGESKWRVLQEALQDGPVADMPIRALLRAAGPPLNVYYTPRS